MMSHAAPFKCPTMTDNRASVLREEVNSWVRSPALSQLVEAFGSQVPPSVALEALAAWLLEFSERWDFRRLQQEAKTRDTGEGARWLLDDSQMTAEQRGLVGEAATTLGLIGVGAPAGRSYDYVLVLGGAKLSCLLRPKLAAQVIDQHKLQPKKVAFLASARPVADSEREATDTYAPNAVTEFDLMNAGSEQAFALPSDFEEDRFDDADNPNRSWVVRHYPATDERTEVVSLSAPSSEPEKRRANSVDTYEFFLSRFGVAPESSLLLVTSQIYVPYQHLEALRTVALPHNLMVETIGFPAEWGGQLQGMAGPTNYLQEIRSTIQAINRFLASFPSVPQTA